MAGVRITELDPTTGLEGTDQIATSKGAEDYNATITNVLDYVKTNFTPAEILAKLVTVDGVGSGLDSDLLQGLAASYFLNAGNLNAGTVPDARLPSTTTNPQYTAGSGTHAAAGSYKDYIQIPEFLLGGQRYMIQFGWGNFVTEGSTQTITYRTPFASGFGAENKPLVILSPECRSSEWNGSIAAPGGAAANVELDMKLWYSDLTAIKVSVIRNAGALTDYVRANWIAIGKY